MNNTHIAISNADNVAFAVIRIPRHALNLTELKDQFITAIEDETGDAVEQLILDGKILKINDLPTTGCEISAKLNGYEYTYYIYPTWEY